MKKLFSSAFVFALVFSSFSACVNAPRWRLDNSKENNVSTNYERVGGACLDKEGEVSLLQASWKKDGFFHSTVVSTTVFCQWGRWHYNHKTAEGVFSLHILGMFIAIVLAFLSLLVYRRGYDSSAAAIALASFLVVFLTNLFILFNSIFAILALVSVFLALFFAFFDVYKLYRVFLALFFVSALAFLLVG